MSMHPLKFIDLFAGIGGFHLALHKLGAECVFASEIDQHARKTYRANFEKISPQLFQEKIFEDSLFNDDITKITAPKDQIPDFDILCAGFPCQPFSQAGYKRGFGEEKDKRGNMFFILADILAAKRPRAFFLENVRHLVNHDNGKTFETIQQILTEQLGYSFYWKVVFASDYGLPQHRPRVFMVGFRQEDKVPAFQFPEKKPLQLTMSDIFKGQCNRDVGFTLRVGGRGSGLHDRRNWDNYLVDNKERRLTSQEGKRMMGYPDNFIMPVTETQAMKQLGNSVAVDAVYEVAQEIIRILHNEKSAQKIAA